MKGVNSDEAYEYIRQRILSGEYPPGSTLTTSQLAEDIGVSRTPVRDALRQLETDGLVVIRAHYGASVRSVTFKEFREMCEMRLALESYAAGFAATNRTDEELREMGAAMEEMRRITELNEKMGGGDSMISDLVREDIRFHIAILTAARNDVIRKEIMQLHRVTMKSTNITKMMLRPVGDESTANHREVLEEHQAILRAIGARDAEGAKQAMHRHIHKLIEKQISLRERSESKPKTKPLTEEELIYST